MEELSKEDRILFEGLLKTKPQKHNGYMRFTKGVKHYKRSRVLLQLHLNKKLSIYECVHHKDEDKTNDSISNLEVIDSSEHTSLHHGGTKRKRHGGGHNKISRELEEEIYRLCKTHTKKEGSPKYEMIGRILGLAGQTIRGYHLAHNNS